MRSKQDSTTHSKINLLPPGTPTKKFIKQTGADVEIGSCTQNGSDKSLTINCQSRESARQLALELSGTKQNAELVRQKKFSKLLSHPWYGTVILEDLTSADRNYIVLFISENSGTTENEFTLKVHRLFVDDPEKLVNHALIQEILSVVAQEDPCF